ncbi:Proton-coupled amino acid transporter 1 [Hordeum vulgare]|nr:Proton-coupled amino acid transporter 1 [Hordeum vulgare]
MSASIQQLGNIVVSIIGSGVFGLPNAFRTVGWLTAPALLPSTGCSSSSVHAPPLPVFDFEYHYLDFQGFNQDCTDKPWEQETEEDVLKDEQSRHGDGDNYTYDDLSDRCFDTVDRHFTVDTHFTQSITVLCQTGGTVAYLVIISQNISSVLPALKPSTVVCSFVRSLSALAPFSTLDGGAGGGGGGRGSVADGA